MDMVWLEEVGHVLASTALKAARVARAWRCTTEHQSGFDGRSKLRSSASHANATIMLMLASTTMMRKEASVRIVKTTLKVSNVMCATLGTSEPKV